MKIRKIKLLTLVIFLGVIIPTLAYSAPVPIETAQQVGLNFYSERSDKLPTELKIVESFTEKENEEDIYYVFNMEPTGFVIVTADDIVTPILGYSNEQHYGLENHPPQFDWLLSNYKAGILYAKEKQLSATKEIRDEWARLSVQSKEFKKMRGGKDVTPLLTSTWGQGQYYNAECPPCGYHEQNQTGHCPVGCVALAMGQIMNYWEHPLTGTGSKYYTDYVGDTEYEHDVDFGDDTYAWGSFPDELNSSNEGLATFLYHAGVSVEMDYDTLSSGAYDADAETAFPTYFKYKNTLDLKTKSYYTVNQWNGFLTDDLDAAFPVFYSGGTHAWVVDGYYYDSYYYYHCNWGWEGEEDGYFLLTDLTPDGYDFTTGQAAIFGIEPLKDLPEGYYYEDFESAGFPPAGWSIVDKDADGYNWEAYEYDPFTKNKSASSASCYWDSTKSFRDESKDWLPLTPDNWLITPQLQLSTNDTLTYYVAPQDPNYARDFYAVLLSTTTSDTAAFDYLLFSETLQDGAGWEERSISLAAYASETVYIAFRHYNCTDNFRMKIDGVMLPPFAQMGGVTGNVSKYGTKTPIQDAVVTIWGKKDTTDASGNYAIDSISTGTHYITCSAENYIDSTTTVNIPNGSNATVNFALRWAEIAVSPDSLVDSLASGATKDTSIVITNNGTGTLEYSITVDLDDKKIERKWFSNSPPSSPKIGDDYATIDSEVSGWYTPATTPNNKGEGSGMKTWYEYASINQLSALTWAGDGDMRVTLFHAADFDLDYPFALERLRHYFYYYTGYEWPDSTFQFVIYDDDGVTQLYRSDYLEAPVGTPSVLEHVLPSPICVVGDFYFGIDPVDDSGHPSTCMTDEVSGHSYYGPAGSFTLYDGYEYIQSVYIGPCGVTWLEIPDSLLVGKIPAGDSALIYVTLDATELGSTTEYGKIIIGNNALNTQGLPDSTLVTLKVGPPDPPGAPTDPVPADYEIDVVVQPTLEWTEYGVVDSAKVWWTDGTTPDSVYVTTFMYEMESALSKGTNYQWRVTCYNASGDSTSPIWHFTTMDEGNIHGYVYYLDSSNDTTYVQYAVVQCTDEEETHEDVTDANGEFDLTGVLSGERVISVEALDFITTYDTITVVKGTTVNDTIEIEYDGHSPQNLSAIGDNGEVKLGWEEPSPMGEVKADDGSVDAWYCLGTPHSSSDAFYMRLTAPCDGSITDIAVLNCTDNDVVQWTSVMLCPEYQTSGKPDTRSAYRWAYFSGSTVEVSADINDGGEWLMLTLSTPHNVSYGDEFYIVVQWPDGGSTGPFVASDYDTADNGGYSSNLNVNYPRFTSWSDPGLNFMMRAYMTAGSKKGSTYEWVAEGSVQGGGALPVCSLSREEKLGKGTARIHPIGTPTIPDNMNMSIAKTCYAPPIKAVGFDGNKAFQRYRIYRGPNETTLTQIDSTTSLSYTDNSAGNDNLYYYAITAVYDQGESPYSNIESAWPTAAASLTYSSDFEANDGGWYGSGDWEWGVPDPTYADGPAAAYSGSKCWGTDLDTTYSSYSTSWLTEAFDLSSQNAQVKVAIWYDIEYSWDYGYLAVDPGNDGTYTIVRWYTGSDPQWSRGITEHISLPDSLCSAYTKVAFILLADNVTEEAGFYVDDIVVSTGQPVISIAPTDLSETIEIIETATDDCVIDNTGNDSLLYIADVVSYSGQKVTFGPLDEDFEDMSARGWSLYNATGNPSSIYYGDDFSHTEKDSVAFIFYSYYYSGSPQWLISPKLKSTSDDVFSFWYWDEMSSYAEETFDVWYSTAGPDTSNFTTQLGASVTCNNSYWNQFEETLPAADSIWVGIRYTSDYLYWIIIDEIEGPAHYLPPTDWLALTFPSSKADYYVIGTADPPDTVKVEYTSPVPYMLPGTYTAEVQVVSNDENPLDTVSVTLTVDTEITYEAQSGWNVVGYPLNAGYADVSDIGDYIDGLLGCSQIKVWSETSQDWITCTESFNVWVPDSTIQVGEPLIANVNAAGDIPISGSVPDPMPSYTLQSGANAILLPINRADITKVSELNTAIVAETDGVTACSEIKVWSESSQDWITCVESFGSWDPDSTLQVGEPIVVTVTGSGTWPPTDYRKDDKSAEEEPDGITLFNKNLLMNYPNPFRGSTTIQYAVKGMPITQEVEIRVYNLRGQRVETMKATGGQAVLDTRNLATGIYFYQIKAENYNKIKKMMILK